MQFYLAANFLKKLEITGTFWGSHQCSQC